MTSSVPTEVELKLLLTEEARAVLERHPMLQPPRATPPEVRDEQTTYYDSPKLGLARRGLSLRVRRSGHRRIQTLKSAPNGAAVATSRGEWEWRVNGDAPDLARIADTPFAADVAAEAEQGLHPVFATEIRRSVRHLSLPGGAVAEIAFDHGHVSAGSEAEPVHELELELKQGSPGPLYRLALDLHQAAPFTIGAESKAARGLRLRTGERPKAIHSDPPTLDKNRPAIEAVRSIIGAELAHIIANQPAAGGRELEGIHQSRVGIRRLRTALVLFDKHLEPHATKRFTAELKRLGHVFGQARDWDVFCTETLGCAEQDPHVRGWAELLRPAAEAEQQAAHDAVKAELQSPALTALVLAMAAWTEPQESGTVAFGAGKLARPLGKLGPRLLDRMARRVARRARDLRHKSTEDLHALRKALKKLRYSVEYLAGSYKERQVKPYNKAIKRLLDVLGSGNDSAVAVTLATSLAASRTELVPASAAIAEWVKRRGETLHDKLPKAWAALSEVPAFWR